MQDAEHLLLALERLEQAPEGLAAPRLRLVGQVRDPADHHVRRCRSPPEASRSTSATISSRSCAIRGRVRGRAPAARPARRRTSARGSPGAGARRRRPCPRPCRSGRSTICLSTRPCCPITRTSSVGPMSTTSTRTICSSEAPGRDGEPGVLGEPAEELDRALQDLLEVEDRLGEVRGDRPALGVAEPPAGGRVVDVVAVARVGRDPSGARVRVASGSRAPRARPARCGSWRSRRRARVRSATVSDPTGSPERTYSSTTARSTAALRGPSSGRVSAMRSMLLALDAREC